MDGACTQQHNNLMDNKRMDGEHNKPMDRAPTVAATLRLGRPIPEPMSAKREA